MCVCVGGWGGGGSMFCVGVCVCVCVLASAPCTVFLSTQSRIVFAWDRLAVFGVLNFGKPVQARGCSLV
jgi:hypothetical protein